MQKIEENKKIQKNKNKIKKPRTPSEEEKRRKGGKRKATPSRKKRQKSRKEKKGEGFCRSHATRHETTKLRGGKGQEEKKKSKKGELFNGGTIADET